MLTSVESNQPAFQGIEKNIFRRICRLLTRNIQLIFVFDGPGVPAKRGKKAGRKIDGKRFDLLKQVLCCLGIPYQEAPGEAEAQCARLQKLGIVDAVWSQDSDCLMFGCSLWIHDQRVANDASNMDRGKGNTTKDRSYVRVVRAKDMQDKLSLDREGLVLFAMLAGGDYHETGLRGCGAAIALSAVKEGYLAKTLCLCRNQRDCDNWRSGLAAFLRAEFPTRTLAIPTNFPDYEVLQNYYKPNVSTDKHLKESRSLDLDIPRPIQEHALLEVTSTRFNIWGKQYMDWVGPVLLARSLLQRDTSHRKELVHDIKPVKQQAKKSERDTALRAVERKIRFSPFGVTTLGRRDLEGGERDGMWAGRIGVPFDPSYRVKCDYFPMFCLQQALPTEIVDPPSVTCKQKSCKRQQCSDVDILEEASRMPALTRRKLGTAAQTDGAIGTSHSASHKLQRPQPPAIDAASLHTKGTSSTATCKGKISDPTTRDLHLQRQAAHKAPETIDLSTVAADDDMVLRRPPERKNQKSPSLLELLSQIADHKSPGLTIDENEDLAYAINLSMQSPHLIHKSLEHGSQPRSHHTPQLVPKQAKSNVHSKHVGQTKVYAASNRASSPSASRVAKVSELDDVRSVRLSHSVTRYAPVVPHTSSTLLASGGASDYIDLTGD